jgi:predicted ATPase/DNA-binding SARP family transcriptional activator
MNPAPLTISLFGPFEVTVRGQPLRRLRSRSLEWLLAWLVLRQGRPVSRAVLAGTLWPDTAHEPALRNLRTGLLDLRRALGPEAARLGSPTRDSLQLDLTGAAVDLLRFDAAVAAGDEGSLQEAVALYRGELLEGCHEEWIVGERAARQEACLQALERLADQSLERGDPAAALSHLSRAEALDPLRDSVQQRRMRALAASGDLPAALLSYREYRLRLHREMSLEPDPETTRLFRELQAGRRTGRGGEGATGRGGEPAKSDAAPLLTWSAPPVAPSPPRPLTPARLPRPLTTLIGREQELQEATSLVTSSPLVTLIGGGGVGKTRLALQIAAGLAPQYPGRIAFVELAPLADPALLTTVVATALGLPEAGAGTPQPRMQALIEWLSPQPALLVLDNCEHLIEAATELAHALLAACPGLHLLATSRERLGLTGELAWRVPSLAAPDPEQLPAEAPGAVEHVRQFPAAQLFLERAAAVRPGFRLRDREEALAVARLCRRLDGIPLALELAAARVTVLPVMQIAARLDDRFRLLTGGSRGALPRHQTLRALIDWSYDGLPEAEAALLRRLSAFAGGWTLEAAEAVCSGVQASRRLGVQVQTSALPERPNARTPERLNARTPERLNADEVLDLLTSLVDRSLVLVEEAGEGLRYRMLETVREYAREKLRACGEEATARTAHALYLLELAETAEAAMRGPEQLQWLNALEAEHDNLRAALAGCLEAAGSGQWLGDSAAESGSKTHSLLPARTPIHDPPTAAIEAGLRLAAAVGSLWTTRHYVDEGRRYLEALLSSPQAAGRTPARAAALYAAATLAIVRSDYAKARLEAEESLAICEELGDRRGIARALNVLSAVIPSREEARRLAARSLALFRECNYPAGTTSALIRLSGFASAEKDYDTARAYHREALALARSSGDRLLEAGCLSGLAAIERERHDYVAARACFQESLVLACELGIHNQTAVSLYFLGLLAFDESDFAAARAFWEECREVDRRNRNKGGAVLGALAELAAVEGDSVTASARWEESLAEGRELGRPDLVVRALRGLGDVARLEGDLAGATTRYGESLQAALGSAGLPEIKIADERHEAECAACLRGIAAIRARSGQAEQAARLLGAAEALADSVGARLPPVAQAGYQEQIAALRRSLGEDAFAAAWAEGRAMSLDRAVELASEGDQSSVRAVAT